MIFCEIGINQGNAFKKLAKKYFPEARVDIMGDLAGIDRVGIITIK
jgi:methylase of polypeptide subunit release factors